MDIVSVRASCSWGRQIYPVRCHVVGGDSDDVLRRYVLGFIERQARLSGEDGDEFLFGDERPGELVGAVRVEVDFDPPSFFYGHESLWAESAYADLGCAGEPGGGTEESVEGDGGVGQTGEEDYDGGGVHEQGTVPCGVNLAPRLKPWSRMR